MKPFLFGIICFKSKIFIQRLQLLILKLQGLQCGKFDAFGIISCNWPHLLKIGVNCVLEDNIVFKLSHPYSKENFIKIGDNVFIGNNCKLISGDSISIGDDCLIACNTVIVDTSHEYDRNLKINKQTVTAKAITIGEDVWIGASCVILQGVSIGTGAVIGAGSVVNKSIPDYEIWAGVPARFIKKRYLKV